MAPKSGALRTGKTVEPPSSRHERQSAGQDCEKKLIHIVYVIHSLRSGGTENNIRRLAASLDASRFRVTVCSIYPAGELGESFREDGIATVSIASEHGSRGWGLQHLRFLVVLIRFVDVLRRLHPDIIHSYLPSQNIYSALARLTTCRSARLVVSKVSLGLYKKGRPLLNLAERWANHVADRVLVISKAVLNAILVTERAPIQKVSLIYNGIDVERFGPTSVPTSSIPVDASRVPTIGVVATLSYRKGHDVLLRAMVRVVEELPETHLLCIGRDGGALASLQIQVEELSISKNVSFLGYRNDVPELLRTVAVVVHPSREEGLCNAILEAMAAGKPVVATNVGGIPEVVVDGKTGRLVPPESPGEMAEAILDFLRQPRVAAQFGTEGRERVLELFSLGRAVRQIEDLYLSLCAHPSRIE